MSVVADLVPSVSIDAILMRRELLREALQGVLAAYEKAIDARFALFGESNDDYGGIAHEKHRSSRDMGYSLGMEWHQTRRDLNDKGQLDEAFKRVDSECWAHLLAKSGLRQLMDADTRKQWDEQLEKLEMPEFTSKNIEATFVDLHARRGEIFEDGVVAVFRKLSFNYRTNSPVKFGKRIIATYACETHSWYRGKGDARRYWTFHGPTHAFCDKLDDLVRAFRVLEGLPEFGHDQGAYAVLVRRDWMDNREIVNCPRDVELHGYLRFRGFKNRNAHVTFLRLDLVDKLNQIIAKRFPNALPPAEADR